MLYTESLVTMKYKKLKLVSFSICQFHFLYNQLINIQLTLQDYCKDASLSDPYNKIIDKKMDSKYLHTIKVISNIDCVLSLW